MSERRQLWETLAAFLSQIEKGANAPLARDSEIGAALENLKQEVRKLGKTQFKTNAIVEDQSAHWEQVSAEVKTVYGQHAQLVEQLATERVAMRERELLEAFLPALDGLENAIANGKRYLAIRDSAADVSNITPEQGVLVSPADRAILAGWLDGLRLVRERMLAILEGAGVEPIPTTGHPFDPYLHVAVGTSDGKDTSPGIVVAEERRGYRCPAGVLRYAEVIVSQS